MAEQLRLTPGQLIARLLGLDLPTDSPTEHELSLKPDGTWPAPLGTTAGTPDAFKVSYTYRGRTAKGVFSLRTRQVFISEGPGSRASYPSPSQAAMRVIKEVNPRRTRCEVNGWKAWRLDQNSLTLDEVFRGGTGAPPLRGSR